MYFLWQFERHSFRRGVTRSTESVYCKPYKQTCVRVLQTNSGVTGAISISCFRLYGCSSGHTFLRNLSLFLIYSGLSGPWRIRRGAQPSSSQGERIQLQYRWSVTMPRVAEETELQALIYTEIPIKFKCGKTSLQFLGGDIWWKIFF